MHIRGEEQFKLNKTDNNTTTTKDGIKTLVKETDRQRMYP